MARELDHSSRGRVLFVLTSHDRLGDTGRPTGYYLSEVTHPHRVFTNRGYTVDFATVSGGGAPMDPASRDLDDPVNAEFLASRAASALETTPSIEHVRASDYAAVFFPGGHGTMWDLPADPGVARLVADIYARH